MERRVRGNGGRTAALLLLSLLTAGLPARSPAQDGGELFRTRCIACHTIGGGRLVGPDLDGIGTRRTEAWLIPFIQHSQAVIKSGDPIAMELAKEYPGLVMPDWPLSADEVRAILSYVASPGAAGGAPVPAAAAAPATTEQVQLGLDLFQGRVRLTNGGPTCNSCHDVTHDAVIGGGVLARDLTTVFTRLGGPGVRAIIGSPPFPVMQRAFQNHPLTDAETSALVAFLQDADAKHALQQPRDYGMRLFQSGVVGAALLMVAYALAWRGRKRESVFRRVFDRQVKST